MTKVSRLALALLVLFVLSGFAGLIYQSVWSHYLGLTLGHAAYAQTLVLAIFMGGMAIGAWLASRYSLRWRRLILGYALVEGVIGVMGLVFHPVFVAYSGVSQETVLPLLGNATLAHGYQWLSAALLIAPQSVLLGATFPLMSAALIRALPNEHGEVLGGLYFSNSLGAACGALIATFVLLPAVGLPGTVMTAGLLNIVVALGAWAVSKQLSEGDFVPLAPATVQTATTETTDSDGDDLRRLGRILLWSTAVSGAASFVYEVGWVRLLNQALGTTVHSFELMLAAFIFGLAFGGLWIRKRARGIAAPVRYVGYVQVWMSVAALLSIPIFTQSFTWVGWMMGALSREHGGYVLFEFGTALISLLVMFPAAFLAGMTLPLFTLALLRAGAGERAIGRIYAANTLGAIAGVALAMHLLIPVLGVRLAITLAALVDGLVGLYLLRMVNPARMTGRVATAGLAMAAAVAFSLILGRPDPMEQASGVFRTGRAVMVGGGEVEYLRDGKTATVAVYRSGPVRGIATNGKPDAGMTALSEAPVQDEQTMIMLGSLPLLVHPNPARVALIGWGSGLSTHTLLGSPAPQLVDTIEIERAMYDGARLFGDRNARAYTDPRSHLRINDARTYFSTGARKYDVIVSEPSNPWVSGVAGLFTREFYGFLKGHLEDDGVLVQWLHTYEIDDSLVGTMLGALVTQFPDADIYATNSADIVVVAHKRRGTPAATAPWPADSALAAELRRVGLVSPADFDARRIGGGAVLSTFQRLMGAQPHSDYFPVVSLQAPRTRFMGKYSRLLQDLVRNGMPVLDILDCRVIPDGRGAVTFAESGPFDEARRRAFDLADSLVAASPSQGLRRNSVGIVPVMLAALAESRLLAQDPSELRGWSEPVSAIAGMTLGALSPNDLRGVWIAPSWLPGELAAVPEVSAIMAAYAAAARRSPAEMRVSAEIVLALPHDALVPRMREQMLVIAMLGALGTGDAAAVSALEARWGTTAGRSQELTPIRSYLMAWADGPVPACMARRSPPQAAAIQ